MRFGGSNPPGHFWFNVSTNGAITNAQEGDFLALSTVASVSGTETSRTTPVLRDGFMTEVGMKASNSSGAITEISLRISGVTSTIFVMNFPIGFSGTVVSIGSEALEVQDFINLIIVTIDIGGNLNATGFGCCGVVN